MRTTLTVDDHLLQLARERAVALRIPLGDVINRALRRGLEADAPTHAGEATVVYGSPGDRGPDDAALRDWMQRLDAERSARDLGA
jgi:hypothetical protein